MGVVGIGFGLGVVQLHLLVGLRIGSVAALGVPINPTPSTTPLPDQTPNPKPETPTEQRQSAPLP